jgi:peptidyl-prolyl cis-trans isomerase B (cyclophilin B)
MTRTGWGDRPIEEQKIQSIVIDTQGVTYPEPETLAR